MTSVFGWEKLLGLKGTCIRVTLGDSRVQRVLCICVSVVTGSGTRTPSDGKWKEVCWERGGGRCRLKVM